MVDIYINIDIDIDHYPEYYFPFSLAIQILKLKEFLFEMLNTMFVQFWLIFLLVSIDFFFNFTFIFNWYLPKKKSNFFQVKQWNCMDKQTKTPSTIIFRLHFFCLVISIWLYWHQSIWYYMDIFVRIITLNQATKK